MALETNIVNLRIPQRFFKACKVAVSKDETRYILNGYNLRADERGLFIAATNGRYLVAIRIGPWNEAPFNVILKDYIHNVTSKGDVVLALDLAKKTVEFENGLNPTFRLIEGIYPVWEKVIPAEFKAGASVYNPAFFNDLSKAAEIYAKGYNSVRIYAQGAEAGMVTVTDDPNFIGVLMPMRGSEADPMAALSKAVTTFGKKTEETPVEQAAA